MLSSSVLQEFAHQLGVLSGVGQVCVLFHAEPFERRNVTITGKSDAVPEFADPATACDFLESVVAAEAATSRSHLPDVFSTTGPSGAGFLSLGLRHILTRTSGHDEGLLEQRQVPSFETAPEFDGRIWIATPNANDLQAIHALYGQTEPMDTGMTLAATRFAWVVHYLSQALKDPISRLPGRMEFELFLSRVFESANAEGYAFATLLICAADFSMVNHRHGREGGDQAILEIGDRLSATVRQTDGIFRYSGAVFAAVLPATDTDRCRQVAIKIRRELSELPYLDESLHLTFTMGGAVYEPDSTHAAGQEPTSIIRRADAALHRAQLDPEGKIAVSNLADPVERLSHFDPVIGTFTRDSEKDYRNVLLLWESISLVSTNPEPGALAARFTERLHAAFKPDRIVLLEPSVDSTPGTHTVISVSDGRHQDTVIAGAGLDESLSDLVEEAMNDRETKRLGGDLHGIGAASYAIPLVVDDRSVGCLFVDGGDKGYFQLDSSDLNFLTALAMQMAIALDRARLAAQWALQKDDESRQLRADVKELQHVLHSSRLIYQSQEMHGLLGSLKKTAASDATILITGESGTGKELVAHCVHDFSPRADAPFVTVDCGAIAHTLLEAELFGHVQGAYTGASSASSGRIAQADGGTLFLDEVAEIPIELQPKLLRFVQEKQFTPVGGTKTETVDIRIVAATNKDLSRAVSLGQFREDLYYRLQVVNVQVPPLRDRRDDIVPLAHFFIQKFANQYASVVNRISDDAITSLLKHDWPGNVRELQHCLVRALLTSSSETLRLEDIELLPEIEGRRVVASTGGTPASGHDAGLDHIDSDESSGVNVWNALEIGMREQIEIAMAGTSDSTGNLIPIGRWLWEDLILATNKECGKVARRAARVAGLPESTFRRQLTKIKRAAGPSSVRTDPWLSMQPIFTELAHDAVCDQQENLLMETRELLLDLVRERVADATNMGSALMGVTPPTYRRWLSSRLQ